MAQFKAGDTVRRVHCNNGGGARVGQLATVVHTNSSGFVSVRYDGYTPDEDDPTGESWCNSFTELVEESHVNKPHKHRDLIIAWANGAEIQMYSTLFVGWIDCPNPVWADCYEYRIKPEAPKYKRFLCRFGGIHEVLVVTPDRQATDPRHTWGSFVKWIDNDWQEVEI